MSCIVCIPQLHHVTQQSEITSGVTTRDEVTDQQIELLDPGIYVQKLFV